MTNQVLASLSWITLVRVIQWMFTVISVIGVATCVHTAVDATYDLHARARAGLNGHLELVGRIARRGALASMIMHVGLMMLGIIALLSPPPAERALPRALFAASAFVVMQLAVVAAQVRNQIDRSMVRRTPHPKE